jgi:hypothetical protein
MRLSYCNYVNLSAQAHDFPLVRNQLLLTRSGPPPVAAFKRKSSDRSNRSSGDRSVSVRLHMKSHCAKSLIFDEAHRDIGSAIVGAVIETKRALLQFNAFGKVGLSTAAGVS